MVEWFWGNKVLKHFSHYAAYWTLPCDNDYIGLPIHINIAYFVREHHMIIHLQFGFNHDQASNKQKKNKTFHLPD
jgi:hypothetical protein